MKSVSTSPGHNANPVLHWFLLPAIYAAEMHPQVHQQTYNRMFIAALETPQTPTKRTIDE